MLCHCQERVLTCFNSNPRYSAKLGLSEQCSNIVQLSTSITCTDIPCSYRIEFVLVLDRGRYSFFSYLLFRLANFSYKKWHTLLEYAYSCNRDISDFIDSEAISVHLCAQHQIMSQQES